MPDLIKVMISSRCKDFVKSNGKKDSKRKRLSTLRKEIKKTVEAEKPFGKQLFEVWINEDSPPKPGNETATKQCLREVDKADILIVLYNGNAGWALADRDVGICHQELAQAWNSESPKVRLIELPLCKPAVAKLDRNQSFQEYVQKLNLFKRTARNGEDAKRLFLEALHDAVIYMVKLGKLQASRTNIDLGDTLDWSLLDFSERKEEIEKVMLEYLKAIGPDELSRPEEETPEPECPERALYIPIMGRIKKNEKVKIHRVLALIHAIPSSMTIAAAREMVGRPFYRDYKYSANLKNDIIGPIHFIGCHKNVTETQVRSLVGYPDIILIASDFGVYMADTVQHTQIVFLAGCCDKTCTKNALAGFFGWLERSGQSSMLVANANSRKNIVSAIKEEYKREDAPSVQKAVNP